jgi:adenylate cyclase
MSVRLLALAGPPKGNSYALSDGDASVGREPANWLRIDDPSVSRRHCLIQKVGDRVRVVDLESRNGTLVNDAPVRDHVLEPGDRLTIGVAQFLFLAQPTDANLDVDSLLVEEDSAIPRSTIQLRPEDAMYLQPELAGASLSDTRVARHLNALLTVTTAISSIRKVDALGRRLLELIFDVVPADRGAILLTSGAGEFTAVFTSDRQAQH